jgi:adenylate kinase family enzyme
LAGGLLHPTRHFKLSPYPSASQKQDPVCTRSLERSRSVRLGDVQRVVILGRGGSGKSTLAVTLREITGLPVIELDKIFWRQGLAATPREEWLEMQQKLVEEERWIIDGDLGPYDAVEIRLRAADTIILLDFSLARCAWRTRRRGRERADFWRWLVAYRWRSRPLLMEAIAKYAPGADVHLVRSPRALTRLVAKLGGK